MGDLADDVSFPAGRWGVGVSGGADSVALLHLCRAREVTCIHLDHDTRAGASAADAAWVRERCDAWSVPCMSRRKAGLPGSFAATPAGHRAARLALFRQAVTDHDLAGVLLAHHAADQAETVLLRLIRGGGAAGLGGMRRDTTVNGLRIVRPLLGVEPETLRAYLRQHDQPWREDASNAVPNQRRNRHRPAARAMRQELFAVATSCAVWREALDETTPTLPERLPTDRLADLPAPAARLAVRRWLRWQGMAVDRVTPRVVARVLAMASDAAGPSRVALPGGRLLRRRQGELWLESPAS